MNIFRTLLDKILAKYTKKTPKLHHFSKFSTGCMPLKHPAMAPLFLKIIYPPPPLEIKF